MLPTSKFGDCSRCPAKNTYVRKRGKDLVCLNCCRIEDTKKQIEKQKTKQAFRAILATPENKELANNQRVPQAELERWFDIIAQDIFMKPKCMECGEPIYKPYYRAATAHILPKAIFPSVATHPLNYLILNAPCGCHNLSHRMDTFSKMKVFTLAVQRFLKFQPQITEKHKLLDEFLKYAQPYINKIQEENI